MALESFIPCGILEIDQLLRFTALVDKMTGIMRHTLLIDKSRRENDAEHSWHIALMALLFKDYAPKGTNIERAVKMCIIHDLVEIYAGDTFAFDKDGNKDKEERERQAADKLFSQIPCGVAAEIRSLWEEFDRMDTLDSRYAATMDRLQPFLHNTLTAGHTWIEGNPSVGDVLKRIEVAKETVPELWTWVEKNIDHAVKMGWLKH